MIRELKKALLIAKADLERVTDQQIRELAIDQQQVEMVTSLLAAAEQKSGGDLQDATAKASKKKKLFHKVDKNMKWPERRWKT